MFNIYINTLYAIFIIIMYYIFDYIHFDLNTPNIKVSIIIYLSINNLGDLKLRFHKSY